MVKFKDVFVSGKAKVLTVGTALFASIGTSVFADAGAAVGTKKVIDDMKGAFGDLQTTALTALGAVGVIAIVLFAGIYAWRYGKQVFKVVAK
uniref:hypothetical protein n=1 Tax=Paenibacillus popilliae TaxID=78057 RepID=UPI00186908D8|nr:hypothetical protein [Paenibacillus popilliae]